jgi:hypothetical protein
MQSCANRENTHKYHNSEFVMNVSNNNDILAKEIFSSAKLIPLETSSRSLIGQIDDVIITDNEFVILDKSSNRISVFNKKGKYLRDFRDSIDTNQILFSEVTYNEDKKIFLIKSANFSDILLFNISGDFIGKCSPKIDFNYFYSFGNSIFFIKNYASSPKELIKGHKDTLVEIIDLATGKSTHKLFEYDANVIYKTDLYDKKKAIYKGKDNIINFSIPGSLSFYSLDPEYKIQSTKINIKSNGYKEVPEDFLFNIKYMNKRNQILKNDPDLYYDISSIYSTQNTTLFTLSNLRRNFFIIKSLNDTPRVLDKVNYNSDFFYAIPPINQEIIGADRDFFYSFYTARDLFSLLNLMPFKDKFLSDDPVLNNFYTNNSIMSNPVLIAFNFKHTHH